MINHLVGICPTLERQDLVRQMVASYLAVSTSPPAPMVVVASGAEDGTEGWCQNQAKANGVPLTVLRSVEPLCYAKAVNAGVKHALAAHPETQVLLLLNNDLVIQPGFFEALAEMFSFGYDIVGAKLLYPPGHPKEGTIQHCGKWFTLDQRSFHVGRWQPADFPQSMRPVAYPDVTFACVAIKRTVWEGVGGLDEGYTNGWEDDDFCMKAREGGAQIGVHPGVLAWHGEASTTGMDNENKARMFQRFSSIWIETGRIQLPLGLFLGYANP